MGGGLDDWMYEVGIFAVSQTSINPINPPIQYSTQMGDASRKDTEHFPFQEHIVALRCKAWPWHLDIGLRLPGDLWASSLTPLSMF